MPLTNAADFSSIAAASMAATLLITQQQLLLIASADSNCGPNNYELFRYFRSGRGGTVLSWQDAHHYHFCRDQTVPFPSVEFPQNSTEVEVFGNLTSEPGSLASIRTQSDADKVNGLVSGGHFIGADHVWFGAYDADQQGTWKWIGDNTTFFIDDGTTGLVGEQEYDGWADGEPQSTDANHHALISRALDNKWSDHGDDSSPEDPHEFLCEYCFIGPTSEPTASPPTPPTVIPSIDTTKGTGTDDDSSGVPVWIPIVAVLGVALLLGTIVMVVLMLKKRQSSGHHRNATFEALKDEELIEQQAPEEEAAPAPAAVTGNTDQAAAQEITLPAAAAEPEDAAGAEDL